MCVGNICGITEEEKAGPGRTLIGRMEIKSRPICNYTWTQTKCEHFQAPNTKDLPILANVNDCCLLTNYRFCLAIDKIWETLWQSYPCFLTASKAQAKSCFPTPSPKLPNMSLNPLSLFQHISPRHSWSVLLLAEMSNKPNLFNYRCVLWRSLAEGHWHNEHVHSNDHLDYPRLCSIPLVGLFGKMITL